FSRDELAQRRRLRDDARCVLTFLIREGRAGICVDRVPTERVALDDDLVNLTPVTIAEPHPDHASRFAVPGFRLLDMEPRPIDPDPIAPHGAAFVHASHS